MQRWCFARGIWWVPLYFNCRIQEELCSPSRNWHLRKACPCLKKGGSLQAAHRMAEPSRFSLSSRSVQLQQQQVLSSCCNYAPVRVFSCTGRQIESPIHPQPFHKEIMTTPSSTTPDTEDFLLSKCHMHQCKALSAGKMVVHCSLVIPRFFLLHH